MSAFRRALAVLASRLHPRSPSSSELVGWPTSRTRRRAAGMCLATGGAIMAAFYLYNDKSKYKRSANRLSRLLPSVPAVAAKEKVRCRPRCYNPLKDNSATQREGGMPVCSAATELTVSWMLTLRACNTWTSHPSVNGERFLSALD